MKAITLNPTHHRTWPVGLAVGCVSGIALFVAGVWNALILEHVTVSSPPSFTSDTPEQSLSSYWVWYAGTVPQQRADSILAIAGVIGLLVIADALNRWTEHDNLLLRAARTLIGVGGVVWVVGQLLGIGGHRAVALMATHSNPIEGVNSIAFTLDTTIDALSAASFVLLGLAFVTMGAVPLPGLGRRWTALTMLIGLVALLVAVGYIQTIDLVTTYVVGALAALLLPAWLLWTGRYLDSSRTEEAP